MNSVDVIRIVDDDPSITDALSFLLEGEGGTQSLITMQTLFLPMMI